MNLIYAIYRSNSVKKIVSFQTEQKFLLKFLNKNKLTPLLIYSKSQSSMIVHLLYSVMEG